jgi:hypothetical protein
LGQEEGTHRDWIYKEANTNSGGMQEYRDNNHFHKNCVLNKSPNGNNKPKLNVEIEEREGVKNTEYKQ